MPVALGGAGGGVNGRTLQLVTRDDGYQPDRARDNTLSLVTSDRVFALLGYVGTDTSVAAIPTSMSQIQPRSYAAENA